MAQIGRIPKQPRTAADLSDDELEYLLQKAEADAEAMKNPQAATAPVEGEEVRGTFLPFTRNTETNERSLALPGVVKEPIDAFNRMFQTAREADFSQGVPKVTEEQIADSFNLGGVVTMPSLVKAPMDNVLFANPIPQTHIPQNVKKQMKLTKAPQPPTVRQIIDVDPQGPKDLETLEKSKDLYKTYILDEKTALSDIAERAGVPNLQDIRQLIDQDTQLTGLMRVNHSMKTGKLRTHAGNFDVPVPPEQLYMQYKKLPKLAQTDVDQYLKLRDFTDDLKLRIAKNIDVQQSQQMLADAQNNISLIEQRTPITTKMAQDYRSVTEGVRNFLATGKNAMLSQKALAALGQERPNYVPIDIHGINPNDGLMTRIVDAQRQISKSEMDDWFLQNRDIKNVKGIEGRADSFETLMNYTRNALQTKMENDVRGQYADAITNSSFGSGTMRKAKPEEADKHSANSVDIYENGEKTRYLASRLQADLLRFDPHVAQFPIVYAPKRLFEMGTTGPLSLTFAPVNMIRDMLTGAVTTPGNLGKPGLLSTVAAVPQQLYARGALGASLILKSSFRDLPFLPPGSKNQLAQAMSAAYAKSMTALANDVGGVDASMMHTNVRLPKGAIGEIKRSIANVADKVPGANFLGRNLGVLADGWDTLFGAISDAPRLAAFTKSVKKGINPSTAAVEARRISGDSTRSGRVYKPDGTRIDANAVDKPYLAGAAATGAGIQFLREAVPYVNPMLQGMRRLGTRILADPIKVNLNAWKYVGLPAAAAYGWNEMLGEEYNDYAMRNRSSRDQATNIYIGLPGLPPERGLEIPLPQELMPWNAPWTTALYNMGRGDQDVGYGLKHMAGTILQNGAMVGYPTVASQAFNLAGIRPPESIMTPWADAYEMSEDNVGFLPQNIEMLARSTFGGISDLVLQSVAAGYEDGPAAFAEEFAAQWAKKLPLVKNITGMKTATSNFSPISNERERKIDSLNTFLDAWDEHFNPEKLNRIYNNALKPVDPDTGLENPGQITTTKLAPPSTPVPTNPVFKNFGEVVKSFIGTNDEGMSTLKSHYSALTKQVRLLRGYTAGNASQFHEYQKTVNGAKEKYEAAVKDLQAKQKTMKEAVYKKSMAQVEEQFGEAAKAEQLYQKLKVDLGNRGDVNRLINYLEEERTNVMSEQITLIKKLEDFMTQQLHQNGMLPPNTRFDVEKHLSPLVPGDFKMPALQ